MRVLLLSYHYPPAPAVGSLRAAKVARALCMAGHEVTVVTANWGVATPAMDPSSDPGAPVLHVTPWPGPRDWYLALKRRLRSKAKRSAEQVGREGPVVDAPEGVTAWKRYLFSLLWLPDDRQGFIAPAAIAAWRRMRGAVDLVYTTAPPFSVHLAGLLLRGVLGSSARWVMEFRDPWTDNPWKPRHVRSRFSDAADGLLERWCLGAADQIVVVSEGMYELLSAKLPSAARHRLVLAPSGIERIAPARRQPRQASPLRIAYAGTLYHRRDPRPFLRAIATVRQRCAFTPQELQVDFVGHCRWYHDVSIESAAAGLGLADVVRFHDWVDNDACLAFLGRADLLLLLAQGQPVQIPNKLYEYLGTGVPILAYADRDGDVARLLHQVGGHRVVADDDVEAAANAIESVRRHGTFANSAIPDPAALAEFTTERQLRRLVSAIGA